MSGPEDEPDIKPNIAPHIAPKEEPNREPNAAPNDQVSDEHDEPMPEGDEEPPRGWRVMAVVRWALVVAMALLATFSVAHYFGWTPHAHAESAKTIYYCPMHPGVQQDHPGECPICSMTLVPKTEGATSAATSPPARPAGSLGASTNADPYFCPMHPDQTSKDPHAKCPICGMNMEARPARPIPSGSNGAATPMGAAATPASSSMSGMTAMTGMTGMTGMEGTTSAVPGLVPITLTFDRVQLVGMKTAKATRETLGSELHTVGVVAAPEGGIAKINPRVAGWIEQLFVTDTGQKVKAGQPLAAIYSPQILAAEQDLLTATKWIAMPSPDDAGPLGVPAVAGFDADARMRLELLGVSKGEIAAIEKEGKLRRTVTLYAPRSGYVLQKNAVQGLYFQPGSDLFTIGDLSKVWVLVDVYENEIPRIAVGERATVSMAALPGRSFTGELSFLYPNIEATTRTLRARIELANPDLALRPGAYGDVVIALPGAEGVVVPVDAVVDTGEMQYVFVDAGNGHFEPRRVRVGVQTDSKVQLLEGVAEGESVVTTGNFLLDSESRLRATLETMPATSSGGEGPSCQTDFDHAKFPERADQCRQCELVHRGMGTMEQDCKNAIAKPWK